MVAVVNLGTVANGGPGVTVSLTTIAAIPASTNIGVYVAVYEFPPTVPVTTDGAISDGVNTYTVVTGVTDGGGGRLTVFQAFTPAARASGTALVYTSVSATSVVNMSAFYVTRLITGNPLDSITINSTASSVTLESNPTTTSNDFFIAACGYYLMGTDPGYTLDTSNGWSNNPPVPVLGSGVFGSYFYGLGVAGQVDMHAGILFTSPDFTTAPTRRSLLIFGVKTARNPIYIPVKPLLRR